MAATAESKSEKEKMLAGELYFANDKELFDGRQAAKVIINEYNRTQPTPVGMKRRTELLTQLFTATDMSKLATPPYLEPPFYCDYGYNCKIGNNVYMNYNCVILDCNIVEIGDNTMFGPAVQIYAATHPTDPAIRATMLELAFPIKIGKDCWIGGNVTILPGVTIGDGSTIGAGSVVVKDIPPYCVAAGNPAKVIKRLPQP